MENKRKGKGIASKRKIGYSTQLAINAAFKNSHQLALTKLNHETNNKSIQHDSDKARLQDKC
jgi:hypothetical protein